MLWFGDCAAHTGNCQIDSSPARAPNKQGGPLFEFSTSDEGASGADASQLFLPAFHSSPVTSPAPALSNDEEGFVLDTSFFDIVPPTPDLTAAEISRSSQTREAVRDDAWSLRRFVSNRQHVAPFGRYEDTHGRSPPRIQQQPETEEDVDTYEDPLAEFEAWLTSGAVEIVEE